MLRNFLAESNRIENEFHAVTQGEVDSLREFLESPLTLESTCEFQEFTTHDRSLRILGGMDIIIGGFVPPRGGIDIKTRLVDLLSDIKGCRLTPFVAHCRFETLHPFMDGNGRTGRAIWLWQMNASAKCVYQDSFLQTFYYQALDASDGRN